MFKVFPATITTEGKKLPLEHGWYDLSTSDPLIIEQWRTKWGARFTHFGIPMGEANGLMAFDFDFKEGKDPIKASAEKGLVFPPTLSQRTISGGFHLLYRIPKDVRIGNTVSTIADGLDTRGHRGYIIDYNTWNGQPIADCPQWIIDHFKREERTNTGSSFIISPSLANQMLEDLCSTVISAPPQESNNTLNASAFAAGRDLVATGSMPREKVEQSLYAAALQRGKSDREARATIESGIEGGLRNPSSIVCPFDNAKPIVNMAVSNTWCPPKPTREQFFDFSHLRRPQNFREWSPRDITLLTADGGSGKTTLLVNEAICLALGVPFLGFSCVEQGKTLFITGEDSDSKIYASMGKAMKDMGLSDDQIDTVVDSIRVKKEVDMTITTKDRSGYIAPDYRTIDAVMTAVDEMKPKMIVIDPISSFWGSEAGLNDMSKAVAKWAGIIRDRSDAQIVLVNHMGKQSSNDKDLTQFAGRGGSALPSHARVVRTMVKMHDDEYAELTGKTLDENQYGIKLLVSKFSDFSPILDEVIILTRTGHVIERTMTVTQPDEQIDTRPDIEIVFELVADYTRKGLALTEPAIQSMARISKDRVRNALNHLTFNSPDGYLVKRIVNPDITAKEKTAYVVVDKDGFEIK